MGNLNGKICISDYEDATGTGVWSTWASLEIKKIAEINDYQIESATVEKRKNRRVSKPATYLYPLNIVASVEQFALNGIQKKEANENISPVASQT